MRMGIMGLKGHVDYVLRGARELGDCQIVAVSDDDERLVEDFKRREPLARDADGYRSWQHLLEHAMMDICLVADENGRRAAQLVDLAGRGVHILTEKPLTTNLDDLTRVRRSLEASRSRLTMLLTMRHDPKYATMRQLVRGGVIGQVRQVTCQKSYRLGQRPAWFKTRRRLGGTIPYIGIHALDLMWWVTGLPFRELAAFHGAGARPEMEETEDTASILVSFEGGASGTARLDYLRPETAPSHGDDRLRVAGTEGVLEVVYPDQELRLITSREAPKRVKLEPTKHLLVDFWDAVSRDKPSRIPGSDCFYITDVVLRARLAADERKMIKLPPP